MLEPLLQLRGEWRQAAAISVPSTAGEVAELLDKAIDVLDANSQLDEASLVMAADMVCKAIPARADVTAILHMRLVRAAHDFAMVTAVEDAASRDTGGGGSAFDSEEALAAALFAGVDPEDAEAEAVPGGAAGSSRPRIDSKALQRSLSTRVPFWRKRWFRWTRTLLALAIASGGLFYISKHPPKLLQSNVVLQQPTSDSGTGGGTGTGAGQPTAPSNARNGSFSGTTATCDGGQVSAKRDSCSWPLNITASGSFTVAVRWDDSAPLTVDLVDASGKEMGPPEIATPGDGKATLTIPTVGAGSYKLRVINSSGTGDAIHFTATINGS